MINLFDLSENQKSKKEYLKQIGVVLESKNFILGKHLKAFEEEFANFLKAKHAIGVASGTDALRLCFKVLGIKRGDSVITASFTSPFTVIALFEEGIEPIFCDIDDATLTIDLKDAERKIKKNTRAILPVHIFGNPCEVNSILKFAVGFKLRVIEDACQAHGALYQNKPVGNFGDAAAFSFYPTKNLGGIGDGGMIVTNNAGLDQKIRLLRNGGQTERFWHTVSGINSRLDEIQAAVLQLKLKKLDQNNRKRQRIANFYLEQLGRLPIRFQKIQEESTSAYNLFVVMTKKRDELQKFLKAKKIETGIYYSHPVHLQPAFKKNSKLPITEKVCREVLALPIYPTLDKRSQDFIINSIFDFFKK